MRKPKVQVDKLKRNAKIITVAKCGVLFIYIHINRHICDWLSFAFKKMNTIQHTFALHIQFFLI